MPPAVYRITDLLEKTVQDVPIGTNLGLFHVLFALLAGHFLNARGAVFTALDQLGLPSPVLRRAVAALTYGSWTIEDLLLRWQQAVRAERRWVPNQYEGIRPVPADLTAVAGLRQQALRRPSGQSPARHPHRPGGGGRASGRGTVSFAPLDDFDAQRRNHRCGAGNPPDYRRQPHAGGR